MTRKLDILDTNKINLSDLNKLSEIKLKDSEIQVVSKILSFLLTFCRDKMLNNFIPIG